MVPVYLMVMMIACIVITLGALVAMIVVLHKKSKSIETGLSGAISYGALGYVWQYVFYAFFGMFVSVGLRKVGFNMTAIAFVITLVTTILTFLSLWWGIYLTNQKQLSLYRSAAVGIGFSLGKVLTDMVYSYGYSFYFSLVINRGEHVNDELRNSILNTSALELISGTIKCLTMYVIITAMALIMGYYYINKKKAVMAAFALAFYEILMIINLLIGFLPSVVSSILTIVFLVAVAVFMGRIVYIWLKTEEIVLIWDKETQKKVKQN